MATQEDFATLRTLALNCLWSVQALAMHCDREWPPTGRRSIEGGRRSDHFERDCEKRAKRMRGAFGSCEKAVDNWRLYADHRLLDPIRATVAGRPVAVSQSRQYATAHEAAHSLAVEMAALESKADTEADRDTANYDYVFVTEALRMLRETPNVQAIEAGIEHEYQQVVKGLAEVDARQADAPQVLAWTPPLFPSKVAAACGLGDKRQLLGDDGITHRQVNPPNGRKYRFDLDAILEFYGDDAADAIDALSD